MTVVEIFAHSLMVSRVSLAVSILVSIISIVFGSLSMAFQRSHNRKSVKPFCNIHPFISDGSVHISIFNAGLGPMIISETGFIRKNGKIRKDTVNISELTPEGIKYETENVFSGVYIIPPMSEKKVLAFSATGSNDMKYMEKLRELLDEYRFFVVYRDLYDRKYERVEHIHIPV